MRTWLARIPRESKAAAIVLGAALVQVGILSALGLLSTEDREREAARALRDEALRRVRVEGVEPVRERMHRLRELVTRELETGGGPVESRVGQLLDRVQAEYGRALLTDAVIAAGAESAWHWRRPPYPPAPEGLQRRPLREELFRLERDVESERPAEAYDAAVEAIRAEEARPPDERDVWAAARACGIAWRTAFQAGRPDDAARWARHALERYRLVPDARFPSVPVGVFATDLLVAVRAVELEREGLRAGEPFAAAVRERRVQAQRLRPWIDATTYEDERVACREALESAPSSLPSRLRKEGLEFLDGCDALDACVRELTATGADLDRARLDAARELGESLWIDATAADSTAPSDLWWVVGPGPVAADRVPTPTAVALLVDGPVLLDWALAPLTDQLVLGSGLDVLVLDHRDRVLHGDPTAPSLGSALELSDVATGLTVRVVQTDTDVVRSETDRARLYWLAVLVAAALAVVAASILAIRSVLREVRLAQLKTDFVSNLSHELRTPLTGLRMFVETLQEGRVRDEAEREECLGIIAQETERLSSLVDRILQFASFQKGKAPVELVPVSAVDVVRRAVQVFRKRAEAVGAELEASVPKGVDPQLHADRDALVQVLLNLLDNAVKYGGENGPRIALSLRVAGRVVRLDVEDDGPGVPERERDLVFEEFYRSDDLLTRRTQGTGIGLALCRRIVLAHGGRIRMSRSKRLGGALVRVELPLLEESV